MGWTFSHLHGFTVRTSSRRGRAIDEADEPYIPVSDVLKKAGDALEYVYDWGDHWRH